MIDVSYTDALTHATESALQKERPPFLDFLEWLSRQQSRRFMGLFDGAGKAAEKEAMTVQTIRGMVNNFLENGELFSRVALSPDRADLACNSEAFKWLVENKYLAVDGDKCMITQLLLAKLYIHFADDLEPQPLSLSGY